MYIYTKYICICVYIFIYLNVFVCIYQIYIDIFTPCLFIYVCVYTVYLYKYIYVCINICKIYRECCMHVYYEYIYIYTHTVLKVKAADNLSLKPVSAFISITISSARHQPTHTDKSYSLSSPAEDFANTKHRAAHKREMCQCERGLHDFWFPPDSSLTSGHL